MTANADSVLRQLPPFCLLPSWSRNRLNKWKVLRYHFLAVAGLYGLVATASVMEETYYIHGGIGIMQNQPFVIHFLGCVLSLPLVLILTSRVASLKDDAKGSEAFDLFMAAIRSSNLKNASFAVAVLVGLAALAYTVVLCISYEIDIYDAIVHPLTFSAYFFARLYLYLLCYPIVFTALPIVTFYLFAGVKKSNIPYRPFHHDGTGGLWKFFVAVDRPVYGAQVIAIGIALMNYLGWGGMKLVPMILSIAAPVVVTILGLSLFLHFNRVVSMKRNAELRSIHKQQMALYSALRGGEVKPASSYGEIVDKLEATERLIMKIKKLPRRGWKKYLGSLSVLAVPRLVDLIVVPRLEQLLHLSP